MDRMTRIQKWMDTMGLKFDDLGFDESIGTLQELDEDQLISLEEDAAEDAARMRADGGTPDWE